ncbi:hypothetical protein J6590_091789, partial [Homalodisca vitripennis]
GIFEVKEGIGQATGNSNVRSLKKVETAEQWDVIEKSVYIPCPRGPLAFASTLKQNEERRYNVRQCE